MEPQRELCLYIFCNPVFRAFLEAAGFKWSLRNQDWETNIKLMASQIKERGSSLMTTADVKTNPLYYWHSRIISEYLDGNLDKDNRVRVYLPPRQTIIATALLFCLPIIIMGAFLLLGQLKVLGEMLSAILAVLGLLLSYIILFVINRHSKDHNLPTIVEVYES